MCRLQVREGMPRLVSIAFRLQEPALIRKMSEEGLRLPENYAMKRIPPEMVPDRPWAVRPVI